MSCGMYSVTAELPCHFCFSIDVPGYTEIQRYIDEMNRDLGSSGMFRAKTFWTVINQS
jgi:hypothetical protein